MSIKVQALLFRGALAPRFFFLNSILVYIATQQPSLYISKVILAPDDGLSLLKRAVLLIPGCEAQPSSVLSEAACGSGCCSAGTRVTPVPP